MNLRAFVAALGLLAACGVSPEHGPVSGLDEPRAGDVVLPTYSSAHNMYFKVVDDGSSYMQQLYDHVPAEAPDITGEVEHWRGGTGKQMTDYYLVGPSPSAIAAALVPHARPPDREIVLERLDAQHWRTFLVESHAALDQTSIVHAEATTESDRAAVMVDFTPAAATDFAALTARIAGHKLAVLVDGTVVSAPVIQSQITGGHAMVTLGPDGTAAEAQRLALALSH